MPENIKIIDVALSFGDSSFVYSVFHVSTNSI